MIVPRYWAEARLHEEHAGRSITVWRFGWSDTSQEHAEAVARSRAAEAMERIRRGENLPRRERRVPYGAGEGIPIREEIVQTYGETVITRNCYGALCLNTPDVLFVDIDLDPRLPAKWYGLSVLFCGLLGVWVGHVTGRVGAGATAFFMVLPVALFVTAWSYQWITRRLNLLERRAINRVRRFAERHPGWHLRLYRAAAGLRLLALHQTFDPLDPVVTELFTAVRADPNYVRMCRMQKCFRARLTPKPWRVGISKHIRPRHGAAWPVDPRFAEARAQWIRRYEYAIAGFGVCALTREFGSHTIHPAAYDVCRLHDTFCRVVENLPLA